MKALRPAFRKAGGFLLIESMLAVAIFAVGIMALGRCVENCLKAERFRREESLAQRALANYVAQIETDALPLTDKMSEKLKGAWTGMTINVQREPLRLRNEKEQEIFGLYRVTLDLSWRSGAETIHRGMAFNIYPRQR